MTLHVPLSEEAEARLRECAAAEGKDVPTIVAEAIEEKLRILEEEAADRQRRPRTTEEWVAEFRRWVASHKPVGHFVDDSRESIYEGRGE